jgi:hypothetical protein
MDKKKPTKKNRRQETVDYESTLIEFDTLQSIESIFLGLDFARRPTNALDDAQLIMYDAWQAPTRKQAIALAKKALTISADCADAYNLLAKETAKSLDEAIELFTKGLEAGLRAIGGKQAFKKNVGYFWGLLETRPYMRAKEGLAKMSVERGPPR